MARRRLYAATKELTFSCRAIPTAPASSGGWSTQAAGITASATDTATRSSTSRSVDTPMEEYWPVGLAQQQLPEIQIRLHNRWMDAGSEQESARRATRQVRGCQPAVRRGWREHPVMGPKPCSLPAVPAATSRRRSARQRQQRQGNGCSWMR